MGIEFELLGARRRYKQQQSNMAVEGADESRYFMGVQGSRGQEGAHTAMPQPALTAQQRRPPLIIS